MSNLSYLSVCSGIEAATQAWHPLGWRLAAVAEIDPFPCHVLHHHYRVGRPIFMPDPAAVGWDIKAAKARRAAIRSVARIPEVGAVPNFGDLNQFQEWPDAAFDVLVGGTPCQSFSVAGLRQGLADPRGNLALVYLAIADRYRPRWVVWENVPGVLSSNGGRDFGAFLGGLAELGYGFAYRILDAQFMRTRRFRGAVPQRRRRVFVVGYLGDWRRAAAVLFDRESLLGNPPPRRESGQRPAPTLAARTRGGGGLGTDFDLDGGLISMAHGQAGAGAEVAVGHGPTLTCNHEAPIVAHALRGEGFDASEDGTGRGVSLVPVRAFGMTTEQTPKSAADVALTLTKQSPTGGGQVQCVAFDCLAGGNTALSVGDVPGALHGGGKSGGRSAVAISCKDHGADAADEVAPTMRAMGHGESHANAGGQLAVAFQDRDRGDDGRGYDRAPSASTEVCGTLETVKRHNVALPWAVRRLTPRECERLQGFPDDFTLVPVGNKLAADGPRYKALGNSMAVNVMEWIGRRIDMVEALGEVGDA